MRLGIITGSLGARGHDGRVYTNAALGRMIDELARRFPGARLCMPLVEKREPIMAHAIALGDDAITALPPMRTTIAAQRYFAQAVRTLRGFVRDRDALFVRLPFQTPLALLGLKRPQVLQVVSDPVEVVRASSDYHGPVRWLALAFAHHLERTIRRLVHAPRTRTIVNGRAMWDKLGCREGRVVVSTCLTREEMRPRADLALSRPPRVLFVGYLRPEKGLDVLLDAFEALRARRPLRLTLVGGSDRGSDTERRIIERVRRSPNAADIEMRGMVDYGPELFEIFRSHDVMALPSLSEGTPRTLVEARSLGCPVVASRVGGIPTSIDDGKDSLLVAPGSATETTTTLWRPSACLQTNLPEPG